MATLRASRMSVTAILIVNGLICPPRPLLSPEARQSVDYTLTRWEAFGRRVNLANRFRIAVIGKSDR
jgi:hypothetical protein